MEGRKKAEESWLPSGGLIREHFDYGKWATDAPPIFHVGSMLATIAALVAGPDDDRRLAVKFRDGGSHPLHVWIMLVGSAGGDRKTTCTQMAIDRMIQAARYCEDAKDRVDIRDRIVEIHGSPEGVLKSLQDHPSAVIYAPEAGVFFSQMRARYWEHGKDVLMDLYDRTESFQRNLSNDTIEIERPRVSLLTAINAPLLEHNTRPVDWHGGFISRLLLLSGDRQKFRPKRRRDASRERKIASLLFDVWATEWPEEIRAGKAAEEILDDFSAENHAMEEEFQEGMRPALSRISQTAYRLAALYEIGLRAGTDPEKVTISQESAKCARALCRASRDRTLRALEALSSTHSRDMTIVETFIRQAGPKGVTRSEITRRTRYKSREIDEILKTLLEAGDIDYAPRATGGRMATVYFHAKADSDAKRQQVRREDPERFIEEFGGDELGVPVGAHPEDLGVPVE